MDERVDVSAAPGRVARVTADTEDVAGDAADQASRLSMIMTAEAAHSALSGDGDGEGVLEGRDRPMSDLEGLLAEEDAADASDDPMHAGGLDPAPWLPAEQAAMRVVDPGNPDDPQAGQHADRLLAEGDPLTDPFDIPGGALTPEDETLLGIDPYDAPEPDDEDEDDTVDA
jgi:hypothetical protein